MSGKDEPSAPPAELVSLHPVGVHSARRRYPEIPAQLLPVGFIHIGSINEIHRLDLKCRDEEGEFIIYLDFSVEDRIWSVSAQRPGAESKQVTLPTRVQYRQWRDALDESE